MRFLCRQYDMPYDKTKQWYDGYDLKGVQIYNPRSVVMSMLGHDYDSYWTKTETYEALKKYIQMNQQCQYIVCTGKRCHVILEFIRIYWDVFPGNQPGGQFF